MDISWYYTEGELTLKVDGDEHSFSLEELIAGSSVFKARRKKVATVYVLRAKEAGMGVRIRHTIHQGDRRR